MNCDFEKQGAFMVCIHAGCTSRVPILDPSFPPTRYFARCKGKGSNAPQVAFKHCPHLLQSIGSTLLFGTGCASQQKNGVNVTVFGCDLHDRCSIVKGGTRLADSSVVRCPTCDDNPVNRS